MGSCFPGSSSLLCSPVVCKYSLGHLVFVKFCMFYKKNDVIDATRGLDCDALLVVNEKCVLEVGHFCI